MNNQSLHNFHIPVMGLAYTIDTPIRVAHLGISSVISIIDDDILEKMRNFYSGKFNRDFIAITTKIEDYRAKRITAYLDMVNEIVDQKFQNFKEELVSTKKTLKNFIDILPNTSFIKKELDHFLSHKDQLQSTLKQLIDRHLAPGSIDVNIMTKIDKANFQNNEQLPVIYNDAHASLRGFAQSKLSSSLVLSAGMNPRLYSYIEAFEDFFPDNNFHIRKKITLKVSDFRSAMIQGQFLAKKGLWVSEYRIESGLNCGGHAFATEGLLLGPILEEFKQRKNELIQSAFSLMTAALKHKLKNVPCQPPAMKITVQGGVGTAEEHQFLISNYGVDSVGWGSPFLLVPETTCVDPDTRKLLAESTEKDFYVSDLSPLGVLFNTVKGTSNELLRKTKRIKNYYGSSCPKKFLALNKEYSDEGLCTASRKYQNLKLEELNSNPGMMTTDQVSDKENQIREKACLCVGLANPAYMENNIKIKGEDQGVVICPGPNLAYFYKEVSLSHMVRHIYGNTNILSYPDRPNMFMKELKMYCDYLKKNMAKLNIDMTISEQKKWKTFKQNLLDGITYYENMMRDGSFFPADSDKIGNELKRIKLEMQLEPATLVQDIF